MIPKSILGSEVDSLKQIPLTDVPGHYNFKAKLREQFLPGARAIVLVIDSKDKDRLAEAADILYDVVSDIDLATTGVPVLVVCNKQDLQFSKRATQIERDL